MGRITDPKKALVSVCKGKLTKATKAAEEAASTAKVAADIAGLPGASDEDRTALTDADTQATLAADAKTAAEVALTEAQAAAEATITDNQTGIAPAGAVGKNALYRVRKGASVTATGTRIIGAGEPIMVEDLSGGETSFKALMKRGIIVKSD